MTGPEKNIREAFDVALGLARFLVHSFKLIPGGKVSLSSGASVLNVDVHPGKPPILRVQRVDDASTWAAEHRNMLREIVSRHGAVLVRGLGLRTSTAVADVFAKLSSGLMADREPFAPRHVYSEGVYASTRYPSHWHLSMHHELSYTLSFPGLLMFACLAAPTVGGATALTDSSTVLNALPADVVTRFEREGWLLTRNYRHKIGASFADAFSTENPRGVENYCKANAIEFEWQLGGLHTRQRRSAIMSHPENGRRCWFNQIAFFNEWSLHPDVREYFVDLYGVDWLPFNTYFGNGERIDKHVIDMINEVYEANRVREPWQTGDVMLVDNTRIAHGREPFAGPRGILVAMTDIMTRSPISPSKRHSYPRS
jgi:alpha-ketoglutarate-dependent taurine dioxygenase